MLKDFKDFAMRGNVIDMAVGIILGVAFGAIVKSLVADVIMPPIGLLLGDVDFSNIFVTLKEGQVPPPYASVDSAKAAGATVMAIGVFVNTIINFLVVAFVIFLLIRAMNKAKKKEEAAPAEPTTRDCPYCLSTIPIAATRCASCTSDLKAA